MMRTVARASVAGMLAVGAALAFTPTAAAAPGEQITSYDISVIIATNGNAHVTERIAYDFGAGERHGLTRTLPGRTLAGQPTVTSPDGASTMTTTTGNTIRIGNPDTTVTGAHTYVLTYDLSGVVAPSGTNTTLSWYVVDGSWDVPIAAVTETLTVPASATLGSCLAGGAVCDGNVLVSGEVLHIRRDNITPHQTMTVVATVPSAAFTQPSASYTYTYPTSSYNAASTSDSDRSTSGSSSGVGWVLGLGAVAIIIAILAKAGRGSGGSRRSGGYYDNGSYYSNGYYDSSSSSNSSWSDSGSSSSYTDSSSSSSSDSGSSSSSSDSGSW
jgi:hypothetical protein